MRVLVEALRGVLGLSGVTDSESGSSASFAAVVLVCVGTRHRVSMAGAISFDFDPFWVKSL